VSVWVWCACLSHVQAVHFVGCVHRSGTSTCGSCVQLCKVRVRAYVRVRVRVRVREVKSEDSCISSLSLRRTRHTQRDTRRETHAELPGVVVGQTLDGHFTLSLLLPPTRTHTHIFAHAQASPYWTSTLTHSHEETDAFTLAQFGSQVVRQ